MYEQFVEELLKASDRIKSGIRTKRDTEISAKEAHQALGKLLQSKGIPDAARKQLEAIHKDMAGRVQKDYLEEIKKRPGYKPLEVGAAAKDRQAKDDAMQAQVAAHLETHDPKQIKELGHEKQYLEDVNNPKMRSKTAEKLTGGIKQRLATGEGIAVRDKAYGQSLDLQRQMKEKEAQMKAKKGPSEVIRISNAPVVPDEHKNDDVVSNLMKLRSTVTHPDHVAAVDDEINKRVAALQSGTMKKSISESLAFNAGGQWLVKST